MDKKKFKLWNNVVALLVLAVASFTYLSTIEPSASFWDCGEFIASSYKLEVGHPPGNPVFQLIARFFTMFTDASHAAVAVNVMSALCSAFTIFLLYLTIVFFAKRLVAKGEDGRWSTASAIAIFGSGAVGALAYCFSDTFWFSAVEGEVYAMSSLFTALVFWAMTRWYEEADEPYANRWIVLISFLMGLSIGVHLLNLLAVPALVFLFYYRKREEKGYSLPECVKIMLLSVVILGLLVFILIPYLPKMAAYTDLFFVNTLGLPVNSGAAFFIIALIALGFALTHLFYGKGRILLTTVSLCLTTILIGFSLFSIVIIRSSVMPPTNENQPDNAFSLVRYLSREQYGSAPLVYGEYFGAPYDELYTVDYWTLVDGKYRKVTGPVDAKYTPEGKMLFPRMWSSASDSYIRFYQSYMDGKGHNVPGSQYKKPTFGANLRFFFDFQMNWMYWRYFMWNFVGRQNDIHSPSPGEIFYGNWESGIRPIDEFRLGDQRDAPAILRENKGKNHYYFLPLLLGLIGLFYQFGKDKRGTWVTFLLFFLTGIAIVIYLNQPPYQVRERDYAYAGSFYAFSIWIGLAVAGICEWLSSVSRGKAGKTAAACTVALCLGVPALMAQQNWDDHDRSNRKTAVEMAWNYLSAVGENGILVTHGDNDTFPLWYAQEVEDIRTDVRIVNTSLLGTDWYIHQMRYAINESAPLPISVSDLQYLNGTNDYVRIVDTRNQVIPLSDVMAVFKHPDAKVTLEDGSKVDYIVSKKFSIPVNRENVLRSGILSPEYADEIPESIVLEIPADKNFLTKAELFMLDLLDGYQWDRPLHLLSQGGDLNIGIKSYLMYDGFTCKFVPLRNSISTSGGLGKVELDRLVNNMENVFRWEALSRKDYFVDYQNLYTFLGVVPQRELFLNAATELMAAGRRDEAVAMLDKCQECVPQENFPLESICIGFYQNDVFVISMIETYYALGEPEKARDLAERYSVELLTSTNFFLGYYGYAKNEFNQCANCLYYLADVLDENGDSDLSEALVRSLATMINAVSGENLPDGEAAEEMTDTAQG